jgi:ubiquinone/menaquinone biosynthesis C-methylase UbiE
MLRAVGLQKDIDAVDLCCGDGWFTLPMVKVARHVLAIDIDRQFLELARYRVTSAGVMN